MKNDQGEDVSLEIKKILQNIIEEETKPDDQLAECFKEKAIPLQKNHC
jgi:hypothetical protein